MQRIMNNPDNIVDEMLAGFVKCHSDIVKLVKTGEEKSKRRCSCSGCAHRG